jgi:hypothetical protein
MLARIGKHCNEGHRRAADKLKSPARSKEWREIKRPVRKLRLTIRLEERIKKIVKLITQIPRKAGRKRCRPSR